MAETRGLTSYREPDWPSIIPDSEWNVYKRVLDIVRRRDIPFAMGGAFALASYTGRWRNTKDLDLYILPRDRERMIGALHESGLKDYHDTLPYDRTWIYRAFEGDTLVDAIWSMANHRSDVDETWIFGGPEVDFRGERLRILPAEEIAWDKLYILQRERCDWPDCLNLIHSVGDTLDWEHIFERLGDDWPLLRGALSVLIWMAPGSAQRLPVWVWDRVQMAQPPRGSVQELNKTRVDLLDRRSWFGEPEDDSEKTGAFE